MKKQNLILSLLSLTLMSCGAENSETGKRPTEVPSDNANTSESDTTILPSFEAPKTITKLFQYIDADARVLEAESGTNFEREYRSFELGYYTYHYTEINEEGESFSNDTLLVSGTEKKTTEYDYKEDRDVEEDTYLTLNQIDGNDYYSVIDYGKGKERDKVSKEDVLVTNRDSYVAKTTLSAVDTLYTFYKNNVSKNIIQGVDDIAPTLNEFGESSYHVTQGWIDKIGDYQYTYSVIINVTFDREGKMKSYGYNFKESMNRQDEDGNFTEELDLIQEVEDITTLGYGNKMEYDYQERVNNQLPAVDPLDYFLTDYTPVLQSWDGVGTERIKAENNSFPIGMYVEATAENPEPEKALDTKLSITASSNQNVISVSSSGVVKAVGIGTTTLTIESESGIGKNLDVTVVSPSLTGIRAYTYSSYHFKGETETLYTYKEPSNSLEEIEVISLTPDTVEIVNDKDGDPALKNIGIGEAKVVVRSKANPKVKTEVSYQIQEKLSVEQVKKNVVGTWVGDLPSSNGDKMIENAATVIYKEDGTGSLTINSDKTGYTFEVGKAYEFTYEFLTDGRYLDRPVSLMMSTIILDHGQVVWTYSANAADFYYTGENANIIFATGNSEEYGAMVQLSARRVA